MQAEGRAPLTGAEQPDPSAQPGSTESSEPAHPGPLGRRRRVGLFALVAILVVVLDQISKLVIVAQLSDRAPVRLLGGLLTITYTRNGTSAEVRVRLGNTTTPTTTAPTTPTSPTI